MYLIQHIASDKILDQAFQWLCEQREDYSSHNDVWELRRNWPSIKQQLILELLRGEYQFSFLKQVRLSHQTLEIWHAKDSLVLKAIALVHE